MPVNIFIDNFVNVQSKHSGIRRPLCAHKFFSLLHFCFSTFFVVSVSDRLSTFFSIPISIVSWFCYQLITNCNWFFFCLSVFISFIQFNFFFCSLCLVIVSGAQWGDEGKGKVVDMLATDADIVCRCQVRSFPLSFRCKRAGEHTMCQNVSVLYHRHTTDRHQANFEFIV